MADEVSIKYIDRKIDLSMICNFPHMRMNPSRQYPKINNYTKNNRQ